MAGSRESSRTTSEPPGSYELSWLFPLNKGRKAEGSYEPGVQMWFANFRVTSHVSDWIVGRGTDIKIRTFKILIVVAFPTKTALLSAPRPPPLKSDFFFLSSHRF